MNVIGLKIQQLRKEHGFTQKQLAHLLDVTDMAVSYWEAGRNTPTDPQKVKLSKVLGVGIIELFFEEMIETIK